MLLKYRIILSSLVILLSGCVFSQQGSFKSYWHDKQLYISRASQQFLKQIVPQQQQILWHLMQDQRIATQTSAATLQTMLSMASGWQNVEQIQGFYIEQFSQMFAKVQTYNAAHAAVTLKNVNPQIQKSLIQVADNLANYMKNLRIVTARIDIDQIVDFLQNMTTITPLASKAYHTLSIVQDLMKHFDGVAVTEYDYMILSQTGIFLHLLQLSLSAVQS